MEEQLSFQDEGPAEPDVVNLFDTETMAELEQAEEDGADEEDAWEIDETNLVNEDLDGDQEAAIGEENVVNEDGGGDRRPLQSVLCRTLESDEVATQMQDKLLRDYPKGKKFRISYGRYLRIQNIRKPVFSCTHFKVTIDTYLVKPGKDHPGYLHLEGDYDWRNSDIAQGEICFKNIRVTRLKFDRTGTWYESKIMDGMNKVIPATVCS